MNCVRWSMGDVSLHGMGTSSVCPASVLGVTHVPGLNCYLCVWTVPQLLLTSGSSLAKLPRTVRSEIRRGCVGRAVCPMGDGGSRQGHDSLMADPEPKCRQ